MLIVDRLPKKIFIMHLIFVEKFSYHYLQGRRASKRKVLAMPGGTID